MSKKKGKEKLKFYYFSQWDDPYYEYNEFTVLATSENDAWKQIQKKMDEPDGYCTDYAGNTEPVYGEYLTDRSVYKVKCYPVNLPVTIRHLSRG